MQQSARVLHTGRFGYPPVFYKVMDVMQRDNKKRRNSSHSTNSLSSPAISPSLFDPGTMSPDHHCILSSVIRNTLPVCTLECSNCISMVHSNRRRSTSPYPMHMLSTTTSSPGQILLGSPSPCLPRSAPISRKNSVLPGRLS